MLHLTLLCNHPIWDRSTLPIYFSHSANRDSCSIILACHDVDYIPCMLKQFTTSAVTPIFYSSLLCCNEPFPWQYMISDKRPNHCFTSLYKSCLSCNCIYIYGSMSNLQKVNTFFQVLKSLLPHQGAYFLPVQTVGPHFLFKLSPKKLVSVYWHTLKFFFAHWDSIICQIRFKDIKKRT